jgi:hypothetical protein
LSEKAFAEQNLRLKEKKFAKIVCQLADAEAERPELKKEKLNGVMTWNKQLKCW